MKRLLNTLYVTTQGAYLAKDGETVLVRIEKETKLRIPILNLNGIVCFGNVGCSPFLLGMCGERNVAVSFLTENGRFLGRVQGPVSGNVLLRREQYRRADDPDAAAKIVRAIVTAKIANCRTVLKRALRDHPDCPGSEELAQAQRHLHKVLRGLDSFTTVDQLRGAEGDAARCHFGVFRWLVAAQHDGFKLVKRTRRPPLDAMNALLSFLYVLLMHDVRGALEAVGVDPDVGCLHRDRPGRPGLALDLMEEFRPVLADRLALSLVNLGRVKTKGFHQDEAGSVRMDDETRKTVIKAYQERKREEITHPFLNEKVSVGLIPHCQALLFARFLRNDLDGYPPFLWR